ncbi:FadR/GntR family transcriptional regulator [Sodalis sp. dw_96]|uniref:FadR/GntR family transcriptional regulator n=1 Tax=Sodalis sp. dw_96 TaxID=2719794 RepID=UPI001BD3E833|nr:FadR/GntR family transcriptional regulator [Sodalis sp. dw_96]
MDLPTIKSERLYQKIANVVISMVNKGVYHPGQALPAERDLSKQLGVSRASLREALIVLELSGWIEIRSGNGVFVCETPGAESLSGPSYAYNQYDVIQARSIVESELAYLAAKVGNAALHIKLRALVVNMELNISNNNISEFYRLDREFHLLIGSMAGNPILNEVGTTVWNRRINLPYLHLDDRYADHTKLRIFNEDHQHMADAIIAGNADEARRCSQIHLERVMRSLESQ